MLIKKKKKFNSLPCCLSEVMADMVLRISGDGKVLRIAGTVAKYKETRKTDYSIIVYFNNAILNTHDKNF